MTIVEMESAQWKDLNAINQLQETLRKFQEGINAQLKEIEDRMNERQQLILNEQNKDIAPLKK